ncbi:MAG: tripartite tricarboxylate transporter substrate binding protein [Polynucleobacter sp.]|jgi:tripartite-type tricarboxylate transporter receptor subunit TctC|uniref:ABC transporter substrate-binding protein n=1 Tax=Polynucleobacter aenigmaticus TaxID=1743164 RepID=A0A254Q5B3_9BURK|nr:MULTISPECIES: tripartite tricarboxylate transporter substrate binding protein [Polynucleobacter]MDO8714173.1 tripartite tricarboxylate transporter substrate binding protein [Polynucleobacter sp.]OWS72021.1 ABC transporter substrate-binding protein [Polynucleobacter aenigmaticus]
MKLTSLLCTSIIGLMLSSAQAQNTYPSKSINLVVPYGAGGSADSRSRQLAQKMSVILKQPIVIDNKPGAGGNIGTEFVARAAPDGYTIGMGNFAPLAVNKTLFGTLRYDPETALSPIILVEKGPLILVVNPNSQYKTIQDIVTAAKAKPGTLTFSSGGIGGSHQLSAELFMQNAGIQMIHVPYKSGSAALTDLMAGNVDMMFDQMYSAVPSIRADKLRAIAITSKKRSPLFPNLPSFAELGYPKVEVLNWQGFIAPAGTPKPIIDILNKAANEALKDPQLRELMLSQGNEIGGGTPADFAALIKSEAAKWSAVVKAGNIKPE